MDASHGISDVANYGDVRARDGFMRHAHRIVKGDGVLPATVKTSYHVIEPSGLDAPREIMRTEVTEVTEGRTAALRILVGEGSALEQIVRLNPSASEIVSDRISLLVGPDRGCTLHGSSTTGAIVQTFLSGGGYDTVELEAEGGKLRVSATGSEFLGDVVVGGSLSVIGSIQAHDLVRDGSSTTGSSSGISCEMYPPSISMRVAHDFAPLASTPPRFEVTSSVVRAGAILDMCANDVVRASSVSNRDTDGAGVSIVLAAGTRGVDVYAGDPISPPVANFREGGIDLSVPLTLSGPGPSTVAHDLIVTGNLSIRGVITAVNSQSVVVQDKDIELASDAVERHEIHGGGMVLGKYIEGASPAWPAPSLLYDATSPSVGWVSNVNLGVASTSALLVGTRDAVVDASGISFGSDAASIRFGASERWQIRCVADSAGDRIQFLHLEPVPSNGGAIGYVVKFEINTDGPVKSKSGEGRR